MRGFLEALRRPFALALAAVVIGCVALAALSPARFSAWAQEDGPIEWGTVVGWLGAAVAFALSLRAPGRALTKLSFLGLAAFCFFCAGEEVSWGQRLFAFQPPEAFLELNYQQELNVHNLLLDERVLGFKLASKHLVAAIALGYGALLPFLARRLRGRPLVDDVAPSLPAPWLAPFFVAVAAVELAYPVDLAGEAAELVLALCFLLAAAPAWPRAAALVVVVALPMGAGISAALDALLFGSDDARTAQAQSEIAQLKDDVARAADLQKLRGKRSVHRRLYTATRAGYLRFGADSAFLAGAAVGHERKGYFLDPWNNPYWLYFERKSGRVTVYSFGANRMRDTAVKRTGAMAGDDVGATFTITAGDGDARDDEPQSFDGDEPR